MAGDGGAPPPVIGVLALQGGFAAHARLLLGLGAEVREVSTPADAGLVMQLGAEAVFVGSGIFKSDDPASRAKAIVEATTHFQDPAILAKVSRGLGPAMPGLEIASLETKLADRGW